MTGTLTSITAIMALIAVPVALPPAPQVSEPVTEAPVDPAALTPSEQREILKAAADGLAAVKTAKGRFEQYQSDGSVVSGDFALRRPGKMRFDYDDPTPIRIIADGTTVAVEDTALETVDRIPIAATPLGMILSKKIDFEKKANVLAVHRNAGRVSITLEDSTGEHEGRLTLLIDADSYDLLGWWTMDDGGNNTQVILDDVETGVKLDPKLFRIEDPEDEDDEF